MKTFYVVHRRLQFQLGDCVVQAVEAHGDQDAASRAAERRDIALRQLMVAHMVDDDGVDLGGTVAELMSDMGVVSIGHAAVPVSVNEEPLIHPVGSPDGNVVPFNRRQNIIMP